MPWIIAINIISLMFAIMTVWLMVKYLRKYTLPHSHYKRLWGFVRIKYLLVIYMFATIGLGVLTTSLFYIFFIRA